MSSEKIVIDDLIVLGNAVPDIISDYRITVCTAGYSPTYGLVRVYPVPPDSWMQRWNVVEVPLERNSKDTRRESWKIQGSKSEWSTLRDKIKLERRMGEKERSQLIRTLNHRFGVGCLGELNRSKLSLGFIKKPTILGYGMDGREDYQEYVQTQLGSNIRFLTIKNYPFKPVILYRCPKCETKRCHTQQVVEWGVYEWMRKNPHNKEKADDLWDWWVLGRGGLVPSVVVSEGCSKSVGVIGLRLLPYLENLYLDVWRSLLRRPVDERLKRFCAPSRDAIC